jgi:hypothetical protein
MLFAIDGYAGHAAEAVAAIRLKVGGLVVTDQIKGEPMNEKRLCQNIISLQNDLHHHCHHTCVEAHMYN